MILRRSLITLPCLALIACGATPQPTPAAPTNKTAKTEPVKTPEPVVPRAEPIQPTTPKTPEPTTPKTLKPTTPTTTPTTPTTTPTNVVDMARLGAPGLRVLYLAAKNPDHNLWIYAMRSAKLFERMTALIDHRIKMPRVVPIIVTRCGRVNAFYVPKRHVVYMCAELLDYFAKSYAKANKLDFKNSKQRGRIISHVVKAATFVLFHELGHALVGELDLPVTGRNEDVADQLAAWFLLSTRTNPGLADSIMAAANWFAYEGKKKKAQKYWDTHSLGQQRYYNLVCWAYGAAPKRFGAIARSKIPRKRLVRCRREYRSIARAFSRLLKPHSVPKKLQKKRLALLTKLIDDKVPPTADSKACKKAVVNGVTVQVVAYFRALKKSGKLSKDPAERKKLRAQLMKIAKRSLRTGMMLCLTKPWSKTRIRCAAESKTKAALMTCKHK